MHPQSISPIRTFLSILAGAFIIAKHSSIILKWVSLESVKITSKTEYVAGIICKKCHVDSLSVKKTNNSMTS